MKRSWLAGGVAGAALLGVAAIAAGVSLPLPDGAKDGPQVAETTTAAPLSATAARTPKSFADIFARVSPAVVSVDVDRVERAAERGGGGAFPFGVFPFGGQAVPDQAPELQVQATGSGFFISRDGYVVTNNHVAENARSISVRLADGRRLDARLVGRDPATDLAVLKVEGGPFPFVEFETDARPRVGDWVMAVGNPFNLGGTATVGVVSAQGRDIGEQFVGYLQIDAPINRGNSGGPTFDVYGRVVGVNTAIFSPSGGSVGIGFAIPSDLAQSVTRQLIADGKVTRGYIGATIQSVSPEIAESLGLPAPSGALVTEVVQGGPAQRAGLASGDLVAEVDGQPVKSASDLTRRVAATAPDETIEVEILRGDARRTVKIKTGERPGEQALAGQGAPAGNATPAASAPLGLQLGSLTPAIRDRLDLERDVKGAVVLQVAPNSSAAREGVRPGDVVIRAGDAPVDQPGDVADAVRRARAAGRDAVLLLVQRQGRNTFVAAPIGAG